MRTRLGVLTLVLAASIAGPAQAAPDQTGTLGPASPKFDWAGGPGTGLSEPLLTGANAGCAAPATYACDDILLKLESAGDLTVTLDAGEQQVIEDPTGEFGTLGAYPDFDVYVYKSDDSGAASGEAISNPEGCATGIANEVCVVKGLKPGAYLVQVEYWLAVDHEYAGSAVLSNFPAPAAAPAPAPVPAPAPAPAPAPQPAPAPAPQQSPAPTGTTQSAPASKKSKKSKRAKCVKKAKKIKNKAKRKKALRRCKK